ncbi:hypothetical protein BUW91_09035 [Priestia megaterium]|jgi:hypothetical protein|nr:hypothetical protein AZK53_08780 [Priestia megaterium]AQU73436.1 hypothetical protein BUW91_09035 [Priestia megaterium]
MDFIFNFIGNFFEALIIIWLVSFALEKLNGYRIEKKAKLKLILKLSIIGSIIVSIIDLF